MKVKDKLRNSQTVTKLRAEHFLEVIEKHIERVEKYGFKNHDGLFLNNNEEYALYAISKKERVKWFVKNEEAFGNRQSPLIILILHSTDWLRHWQKN